MVVNWVVKATEKSESLISRPSASYEQPFFPEPTEPSAIIDGVGKGLPRTAQQLAVSEHFQYGFGPSFQFNWSRSWA